MTGPATPKDSIPNLLTLHNYCLQPSTTESAAKTTYDTLRRGRVKGVCFQVLHFEHLERLFVRGLNHDGWGNVRLQRLLPSGCTETPTITRF